MALCRDMAEHITQYYGVKRCFDQNSNDSDYADFVTDGLHN